MAVSAMTTTTVGSTYKHVLRIDIIASITLSSIETCILPLLYIVGCLYMFTTLYSGSGLEVYFRYKVWWVVRRVWWFQGYAEVI